MSTEKGLVGITEEGIWNEVHPGLPIARPELEKLLEVALAAQRALVEWVFAADDAGDVWDRLVSLKAKLGVK